MNRSVAAPTRARRTPAPLRHVATFLSPLERIHVDAAGEGLYRSLHRESVDAVMRDVRSARVDAVVLSVNYCERYPTEPVAMMVREFPRVPTVALLSGLGPNTPHTLLTLGTSGVRRLVDVRSATGWRSLRKALIDECGNPVQRLAIRKLGEDLHDVSDDCWRFFRALFLSPTWITTVRRLSESLDVLPSTLMSRFFRARLPAPKRYLSTARLVRAAHLFENSGFSVANVANHLDYSSPQSFGRHVRAHLGLTAIEFRDRFDGEGMLDHFRQTLVLPHLERLRSLAPLRNSTNIPRTPIVRRARRRATREVA